MKNPIKSLCAYMGARNRDERDRMTESMFRLSERAGQLWVTCDGVAVYAFSGDDTAEYVLETLADFRRTALRYDHDKPYRTISEEERDNARLLAESIIDFNNDNTEEYDS